MFKFSYEKLLELYALQENVARRDYNDSLQKLESEKGLLANMYRLSDNAREEIFELQTGEGSAPMERLCQIDDFMAGQKIKIERQRVIVTNHTQIVEQKQEILHMAAKERKILEKLKEKKSDEYKKRQKKSEAKATDEIVVTRYRGRV